MKRKSLIVLQPQGDFYCEGVLKDGGNYKNWLMSDKGGAWFEHEITILDCQTMSRYMLNIYLESLINFDYAFVVFSGHGRMDNNDNTFFGITQNKEISDSEIRSYLPSKATLVLDCCRGLPTIPMPITENRGLMQKRANYIDNARNIFDERIRNAIPGKVTIYSCDKGEYSRDTYSGGLFSKNFIDVGRESITPLSIVEAFSKAQKIVIDKNYDQTPQICRTRMGPYFPFSL